MEANGVNYYKGVLLCSRPNENPSVNRQKVFCGRVTNQQQLGLGPLKVYSPKETKKRVLPVLSSHKKWLEKFKKEQQERKIAEEKQKEAEIARLEHIKEEGRANLISIKNQVEPKHKEQQPKEPKHKEQQPKEPKHKEQQPKEPKHKEQQPKKKIPAWAKTAKQVEEEQEQEVDSLLEFFDANHQQQLKDYLSDQEVRKIIAHLKGKIEQIKEKDTQNATLETKREPQKEQQQNQPKQNDILSVISRQSGAQSVASHKTVERVQQLERKKEAKQWDKMSTSEHKTMASVDEQIAKNIADEVLRNYPALKHHSNQSIRRMLQKSAREQLKAVK